MLLAASQHRRPLQAREKPECGQGQGQRGGGCRPHWLSRNHDVSV